ncbi:MAG: hypothetical protein DMG57_16540 [Acidobacteria bacterium]|nr:MAG: hypothetical protein DMG57_16540 [Acidobacteriota bacterium]
MQQQTQQFPRRPRTTGRLNPGYSASPLAAHSPNRRIPRRSSNLQIRAVVVLIVLSLAAGIVIAGSPIVFEENRGQASREVLFLSRGAGYGVFLTRNRTLIASNDAKVVQIGLVSAKEVKPEGVDRLSAKSNYFIGSEPAQWHTGIFNCARVRYADVYPGIDVLWHGRDGQIEHDFTVGPGGDPRKIRFFFPSEARAWNSAPRASSSPAR